MKNLKTQNLTVYNLSLTGPGQGALQTNLELFLVGFFFGSVMATAIRKLF